MAKSPSDWKAIDLATDSLTLLLGWRPKAKRLDAQRIEVNNDVAGTLREICRETLDKIENLQALTYEDTATLEEGEQYFALGTGAVPTGPPTSTVDGADDAAEEAAQVADLLRLLQDPGAMATIAPGQAGDGSFLFYAVLCQDKEGKQVAFIKQQRGFRVARTGRLLTMFGNRLTRIENPVFSFAHDFDLVIHDGEMAILRSEAYVQLFTDVDVLKQAVPEYVNRLSSSVTVGMSETARERVEKVCKEKASLAKRLRRLSRKGWLSSVTEDSLRAQIASMPELPTGVQIVDGNVDVTEQAVPIMINLFEDVYYRGHHDPSIRSAQTYKFGVR